VVGDSDSDTKSLLGSDIWSRPDNRATRHEAQSPDLSCSPGLLASFEQGTPTSDSSSRWPVRAPQLLSLGKNGVDLLGLEKLVRL
jgi:hypothetical protein